MLLPHDPRARQIRAATVDDPLRVLVSGCMVGWQCGVDGTDYGMAGSLSQLIELPNVQALPFCPEDHGIGTPRTMPDIHGGDGRDVLAGTARVLDEHDADWTAQMIAGAHAMLDFAREQRVELAVLTDMSAACGSQVISDGCRLVANRRYRRGVGVATALLLEAGIPIVSQRDARTLGRIQASLDPTYAPDPNAIDHHETDWYREYFGSGPRG